MNHSSTLVFWGIETKKGKVDGGFTKVEANKYGRHGYGLISITAENAASIRKLVFFVPACASTDLYVTCTAVPGSEFRGYTNTIGAH